MLKPSIDKPDFFRELHYVTKSMNEMNEHMEDLAEYMSDPDFPDPHLSKRERRLLDRSHRYAMKMQEEAAKILRSIENMDKAKTGTAQDGRREDHTADDKSGEQESSEKDYHLSSSDSEFLEWLADNRTKRRSPPADPARPWRGNRRKRRSPSDAS